MHTMFFSGNQAYFSTHKKSILQKIAPLKTVHMTQGLNFKSSKVTRYLCEEHIKI